MNKKLEKELLHLGEKLKKIQKRELKGEIIMFLVISVKKEDILLEIVDKGIHRTITIITIEITMGIEMQLFSAIIVEEQGIFPETVEHHHSRTIREIDSITIIRHFRIMVVTGALDKITAIGL